MDKALAREIGAEAQAALEAVAAKHGLTVTVNGGKYDPTTGSFAPKVEFVSPGGAQIEWDRYATMYGLSSNDLGREITVGGKTFTLTGFTPRRRAYPIDATCDGKSFKLSIEHVRQAVS